MEVRKHLKKTGKHVFHLTAVAALAHGMSRIDEAVSDAVKEIVTHAIHEAAGDIMFTHLVKDVVVYIAPPL